MSHEEGKASGQFDPNLLRNVIIVPFPNWGMAEVNFLYCQGKPPAQIAYETGYHETAIRMVLKRTVPNVSLRRRS